jgi:hypothetical protein
MGANEPDLRVRILRLDRLGTLRVVDQRRGARVQDKQLVIIRDRQHVVYRLVVRRRIHQLAARHKGRRLGQPRGKPVRSDFALRLVSSTGATIESVERRSTQEQSFLHSVLFTRVFFTRVLFRMEVTIFILTLPLR